MSRRDETLARVPLFCSLGSEQIRRLDTLCIWRRALAGERIVDYNEKGTDVFFVLTGLVRVTIRNPSRRAVILGDIGSGGYFGELAAIDGRPRSASVLALTNAIIARMPASAFRDAIHQNTEVCDEILSQLASRIRSLDERVNELSTLAVRHRIHAELLRLSRPDQADQDGRRGIISPPPIHADLAARVSTHREAVTRELKALERAGLLERRRGALVLLDRTRLTTMLEEAKMHA